MTPITPIPIETSGLLGSDERHSAIVLSQQKNLSLNTLNNSVSAGGGKLKKGGTVVPYKPTLYAATGGPSQSTLGITKTLTGSHMQSATNAQFDSEVGQSAGSRRRRLRRRVGKKSIKRKSTSNKRKRKTERRKK